MRRRAVLWPASIAGQVMALLLVGAVAVQVLSFAVVYKSAPPDKRTLPPPEHDARIAGFLWLIEAASPADRSRVIQTIEEASGGLAIRRYTGPVPTSPPASEGPFLRSMPKELDMWLTADGRYLFRLADGTLLTSAAPDLSKRPDPTRLLVSSFVFLCVGLLAFGAWAAFVVTRPLTHLASAVENFAKDGAPVALAEEGPKEVRSLIAIFDGMQTRIGSLLADNTRMLAAVSHDLRTPMMRMRLRAEMIDDPSARAALLADLEHMAVLTDSALDHLRGMRRQETPALVDLATVILTVADQFADIGEDISVTGPSPLDAKVRVNDLQRAIRNLVENAIRYAGEARIEYGRTETGNLRIAVIDNGPGIPEAEKERVLLPFERGDRARGGDNDAGLGLGLSVVRTIAESHGGRLELGDNTPRGLVATIELPASTSTSAR